MPVGDLFGKRFPHTLKGLILSIFGKPELHDHLRTAPLIKNFKQDPAMKSHDELSFLEIGCDYGLIGFELFKLNPKIKYFGFDLNKKSIEDGNELAKIINADNIKLYCSDATKSWPKELIGQTFDYIILYDFLEHLNDPASFLASLSTIRSEHTQFIISVPTKLYPKVFGRLFHIRVGHVMDGYSIEELEILMATIGLVKVSHSFSTGLISSIGCLLSYRLTFKMRPVEFLKKFVCYWFKFFDFCNSATTSCSIFAVFMPKQ